MSYSEMKRTKLGGVQAKHVPSDATNAHLEELRRRSRAVGYEFSEMGSHQRLDPAMDRFYVAALSELPGLRPLKFVLTPDGRVWADNTHWTLAALLKLGEDATISDAPHYFVDLRQETPLVINRPSTLLGRSLEEAVRRAQSIAIRLEAGWRPPTLSFTIHDLRRLGRYV